MIYRVMPGFLPLAAIGSGEGIAQEGGDVGLGGLAHLDLETTPAPVMALVPAETQALITRRTDTVRSLSHAVMVRSRQEFKVQSFMEGAHCAP